MAGRLNSVGSRIMGGNGVVGRSLASSLRNSSGMGLPIGKHIIPDKPVIYPSSNSSIFFLDSLAQIGWQNIQVCLQTSFTSPTKPEPKSIIELGTELEPEHEPITELGIELEPEPMIL